MATRVLHSQTPRLIASDSGEQSALGTGQKLFSQRGEQTKPRQRNPILKKSTYQFSYVCLVSVLSYSSIEIQSGGEGRLSAGKGLPGIKNPQ